MVLLYDGVMIKVLEDVFISTHVLTLITRTHPDHMLTCPPGEGTRLMSRHTSRHPWRPTRVAVNNHL